mgnify:CR=1 FL=1
MGVRCLRLEGVRRLGLVELWKNEWTQIHLVLENKDIIFYIHYVVGKTLNQVNLRNNEFLPFFPACALFLICFAFTATTDGGAVFAAGAFFLAFFTLTATTDGGAVLEHGAELGSDGGAVLASGRGAVLAPGRGAALGLGRTVEK